MPSLSKRFRLFILVGVSIALVMTLFLLIITRMNPENKAKFAKIESGMTEGQVDAIMGVPPGTYTTKQPFVVVIGSPNATRYSYWHFDDGSGMVSFDSDGKVFITKWNDHLDPSLLEKVRNHLRELGL